MQNLCGFGGKYSYMKVIIAGSRYGITVIDQHSFNKLLYPYIDNIIGKNKHKITEIVSGTARGVDLAGEYWATKNNITVKQFPADWGKLGHIAGHVRNKDMAKYADTLIAIWDGISTGTESMVRFAKELNLPTFVLELKRNEIINV